MSQWLTGRYGRQNAAAKVVNNCKRRLTWPVVAHPTR
jgi:hypothetical protein